MNTLNKIKNVQNGLKCCSSYSHECDVCPYEDRSECKRELNNDALEVIDVLKKELEKRTYKTTETQPRFIILTTGIVMTSNNQPMWHNSHRLAIKVDDILMICDSKEICGSEIQLKTIPKTVVHVQENIFDILDMISKGD